MKKLLSFGLVAMLALTAVVSSCSKYDEGSKFTILSAKARVTGDWTLKSATYNGTDVTSSFPSMKVSIVKDGKYTLTYTVGSFSTTETGTWAFNSDKTHLLLTDSSNSVTDMEIVMLKNKEMKLKDTDSSGGITIMDFVQ